MAMPMPPRRGVPGAEAQPEQAPTPDMMGMAGMQEQQTSPMGQNPQVDQLRMQFMGQLRQLVSMVDGLSQTFPAFSPFGEQIMSIAQEGMMQVVSALGAQQAPPSPMAMM